MAFPKVLKTTPTSASFDLSSIKKTADALSVNWTQLLVDIETYGPSAVTFALTLAGDIIAGNYAKAISDLITLGPAQVAAVIAILKDLGINLPIPVPTP